MDQQPAHGESIIHLDTPYEGHWNMGMRNYYQRCTFEELLNYGKDNNLPNPDFWWISAKDFPFPEIEKVK